LHADTLERIKLKFLNVLWRNIAQNTDTILSCGSGDSQLSLILCPYK